MTASRTEVWDSVSFWSVPAEQAFQAARRRARRQESRERGQGIGLVPFHEVADSAGLLQESDESVQSVPLDKIIGSVGKEEFFTHSFEPRSDALRARWKRAFAVAHGSRGYEPIELYEAKGRYYVVDGHFRVSVGQALGYETIQANVHRWV